MLFWGSNEIYYYVSAPPLALNLIQMRLKIWARIQPIPLGTSPWATYSFLYVTFGYFSCSQNGCYSSSSTLVPLVGEKRVNGWFGALVDNFYLVALILAMGTSLGLATPLVTECIAIVIGTPHTATGCHHYLLLDHPKCNLCGFRPAG
ncbi:BCCT family transporter [Shigella flexneri]